MTPVEERIDHESARLAIERDRETRYWTIERLREEYGRDWPQEEANIRLAATRAVDWLLTEHSAREETIQQAEAALRWNMEYAGKMVWMCPSFVYVERESRAAIDLLRSRAAK